MRNPKSAAFRLALAGWLGLAGVFLLAAEGRAELPTPAENVLPASTIAFLKINNATALREAFSRTQFGQLWNDTGMKAWRDDLAAKFEEEGKSLKQKLGVGYHELLKLPLGAVTIAVEQSDDAKIPVALVATIDAGKNSSALTDVLMKGTKIGDEKGSKVTTESFKGSSLHVIKTPGKDGNDAVAVWTSVGSTFYFGSNVDAVKDLVAHAEGRDDSLAKSPTFVSALKKFGTLNQIVWFIDLSKALDVAIQANAKGNPGQVQQTQALVQMTGLQGLKAAAGSFVFNVGNFDSISKTIIMGSQPAQGILKIFEFPKSALRPEAWVPASASSYQTFNFDLDNAYNAIDALVNKVQPGMLQVFEQQLAGPNGEDGIKFQKDIFGPLGNRVTLLSDFKKPIKEENQRLLLAVALQDSAAFQNTLNKLIQMTGGAPKKREFKGTTIYDFDINSLQPNANANGPQLNGTISVAVAKDTLFVSREPTLLEQVLRGEGPGLADSAAYRAVAKEIPESVSSLTFIRPEEQVRLTYDMVKNGQFEKALQNAAVAGGPDMGQLAKMIDKTKLPDFSIVAKYLSQGGGYGVQDDEGFTMTRFTLRKATP